jgi:5-methylthioadenosine/S-adenosylhomocysteine deaminase
MTAGDGADRPAPADPVIAGCTAPVQGEDGRIDFADDAAAVVRGGIIDAVTTAAAVAAELAREGPSLVRRRDGRRIQDYNT